MSDTDEEFKTPHASPIPLDDSSRAIVPVETNRRPPPPPPTSTHMAVTAAYNRTAREEAILAYLLISASSSAATRVNDWVSNWGKDDFTQMATASIGMSFLAFVAFALSSIISGYNLCNQNSL
ncbi:hypothetical protein CTI12_AA539010 [Artemisia annua]|uniref:CASP-like protein n=1 Tax=Artemisia annua TaxID=35608 RepID=A0A2U1L2A3_ARTAN|nr:hypothetical protein CTI12_AA539010 [Artemisia annua]